MVYEVSRALFRCGSGGHQELGEFDQKTWSSQIAEAIKAVKADTQALKLQNEFFEKTTHPLDTKQRLCFVTISMCGCAGFGRLAEQ